MKLELEIGYNDLSDDCKKKIEKLNKICKDLTIKYPSADKFINHGDLITFPCYPQTIPCGDTNVTQSPSSGITVYCNSEKNGEASNQC